MDHHAQLTVMWFSSVKMYGFTKPPTALLLTSKIQNAKQKVNIGKQSSTR